MANVKQDNSASNGQHDVLSAKDKAAFKNMMDLYNQKLYKKGLKIAEELVNKYPKHGEAKSFKALFMSQIDPSKHEEILAIAREAIKNDLNSCHCWYVLGRIYKNKKQYKDTLKCFTMASKIDPQNERLLRDLYALAIEINDYEAFKKFASSGLQLRMKHYKEWMTFAFAQHLCGNVEGALKVLTEADRVFSGCYDAAPFELSSAILYWAMLLEDTAKYNECIKLLTDKEGLVLDKITRLEYVGRSALLGGLWDMAHNTYKQLVQLNPDNARYTLLFIITHRAVREAGIFQMPLPRHKSNVMDMLKPVQNELKSDSADVCNKAFVDKVKSGELPPILLSEEIMDIDGEYSTSNWCGENTVNRTFDHWVSAMRQKTESSASPTKDEQLFLGCYSYVDYTVKVAKALDMKALPKPKSVSIDEAESILEEYLKEYPIARCCIYSTRPKMNSWSRHPLFIFSRAITQSESRILLDALNEVKINNYLGKALTASFITNDHIRQFHDMLKPLVEVGCLSIFKFFVHGCTFEIVYHLLVLLEKYRKNLEDGLMLMDGIDKAQGETKGAITNNAQHNVASQNYLAVVLLVAAKIYDYAGFYDEALELLEQTLKTTPTAIDAHMLMGKVYRHMGALEKSKKAFCMASDIDRSDRQTSSKTAKAMLRTYDFVASRAKWRNFLVEDMTKEERDAQAKTNKYTPPEVKHMKYELMAANYHRMLYIQETTSGTTNEKNANSPEELLKNAHDIYAMVLEKQHEIYLHQLDFHSFCLNRLQYRTYYSFHKIRVAYATLVYFIRAAEGILWTTAEIKRTGLQHRTECEREIQQTTEDNSVNYCLDLIKTVSSQRVYNSGLYSAIERFASIVGMPKPHDIQLAKRAFRTCHRNPYHHHIYPAVFHMIVKSQYKDAAEALSQMLPVGGNLTFDRLQKAFKGTDGSVLTDTDAAYVYLEDVITHLQKMGVFDHRHSEAILRCVNECPDTMHRIMARMDHSYINSICTFGELESHYLEVKKLSVESRGCPHEKPLQDLVLSVERAAREKYPFSDLSASLNTTNV
ncbi:tetratricopeptide repeat containing domain protein, putative [Babesia bigemina]|uniref:Tetratricopeptide repeat containing domain protein, putative n=1 Tax=Babesia bigemina TaxID=5866 RepID=A0A061D6R6_BABBI|nr:tetratricopeptide repeat containing domain protein, putative [Babesia bigemina]CDR94634.1 tetratricopeptide repeat containing domain protein, putative [Babesia bigemina]|eukprot:XP_012766820.1 tetratricopeptide repeat containing domain protein, putative [Babesia bigemina]